MATIEQIAKARPMKHALNRALDAYPTKRDAWTFADIVSNHKALMHEPRPLSRLREVTCLRLG